jgi:hypothetical protein
MAQGASQPSPPVRHGRGPAALGDPQVQVALVTAIVLLVQAVLAKNVLHVDLDFASQTAPLWVFIVFEISGQRDRGAVLGFSAAIVAVSAAILALYGLS